MSNLDSWTTLRRVDQLILAARRCLMEEAHSSKMDYIIYINKEVQLIYFFRSTKNFMKKYNLDLTAATFLIIDSNQASMEVASKS